MKDKKNYIINEDFSKSDSKYYVLFSSPKDETVRIENVHKVQLIRTSGDSVELKIVDENGRNTIFHYPNGLLHLLDEFDIGIL